MTEPSALRAARPIVWIRLRPAAQEALLVRVEDRDERDLRDVEALAQQVDADQHVELAEAQVADDLHALHRIDVVVHVAHADAVVFEEAGQVLGHLLRQRRHEHALLARRALVDLGNQVVDLPVGRLHR